MSNSILGFSPWRRRASSLTSHRDPDSDGADAAAYSDGASLPIAPSSRLLSSSVGSPKEARGPIRSYIHATMRDQLGEQTESPGPPAAAR